MATTRDLAAVKQVLEKALAKLSPEVRVEESHVNGYLHVYVLSEAFQKMSYRRRDKVVWEALKSALSHQPIYPKITSVFPLTFVEYEEDYGPVPAAS